MSNIPNLEDNDVTPVLLEARDLAMRFKHGFIDYSHVFVAILNTDCKAHGLCTHCRVDEWTAKLQNMYPPTGKTMEDMSLPVTIIVERTIKHAKSIADKMDEKKVNSVHILLAILSLDTPIAASFSAAGITFEDVITAYGKPPFGKFPPMLEPLRQKPYTSWERFWMSKSSRKKKADQYRSNAYHLLLHQFYDHCIGTCRIGLSLDPTNQALRELQAVSYIRKRDYHSALALLLPLFDEKPGETNHRLNLSYCYDGIGEYGKAEELLAGVPENDKILNNKGYNLIRQQKYQDAIAVLEKAVSLNPSYAYVWNNLGFARYKLGQITEGLALIDKSLELDKGNSYAYKNKGIIFFEQQDHTQAMQNFQLALKFGYTEKYGSEVEEYLTKMQNTQI